MVNGNDIGYTVPLNTLDKPIYVGFYGESPEEFNIVLKSFE